MDNVGKPPPPPASSGPRPFPRPRSAGTLPGGPIVTPGGRGLGSAPLTTTITGRMPRGVPSGTDRPLLGRATAGGSFGTGTVPGFPAGSRPRPSGLAAGGRSVVSGLPGHHPVGGRGSTGLAAAPAPAPAPASAPSGLSAAGPAGSTTAGRAHPFGHHPVGTGGSR